MSGNNNFQVLKDIHAACQSADQELRPLLNVFEEKRRDLAAGIFDKFESQLPDNVRAQYQLALQTARSESEVKLIKGECIAAAMSIYKLVSMLDPQACESAQPTNPIPVPFRDGKLN